MKHSILLLFSIFIIQFSPAQTFEWAVSMGDIGLDRAWDIQADNWGNVYTIGTFEGTSDFDPGPGTTY